MFCNQCGTANVDEARFCTKCGADLQKQKTPTPPAPDTPGDGDGQLPIDSVTAIPTSPTMMWPGVSGESRYEIMGELGHGGMGVVFKARDRALGRLVALKRLKIANPSRKNMERLLAEAKCLAGLRHFNICQIYDMGWDTNGWYVAMEYLEGGSLSQLIAARGPLDPLETIRIIKPLADALHHAHREGVIHRDVKPQNILFRKANEPVLTDFGIAKAGGSDFTTTGIGMGSPYYMAPEQASDAKHVDGRADIYSLGGTMYTMLTKKYPITLDPSQVPAPLRSLVVKCVEQDPALRYQDCGALLEDLALAEKSAARRARQQEPAPGRGKSARIALLFGALAIFVITLVYLVSRTSVPPAPPVEAPPEPASLTNKAVVTPPVETPPAALPAALKLFTSPEARVTAVPRDGGPEKDLGAAGASGSLEASLPAGLYSLVISKPDYVGATNPVKAVAGDTLELKAELAPLPARLSIRSPQQAEIWEGDRRLGNTGELIGDIEPGFHQFTIRSQGFAPAELGRTFLPNRLIAVDAPALVPLTGVLSVRATMAPQFAAHSAQLPGEAELRIEAEPWTRVLLPCTTNLPVTKTHLVQLRMAGYEQAGSTNVLVSEKAPATAVFQMTPRPGRVRIVCDTPGTRIFENNNEMGKANTDLTLEPFVQHVLEVRADGYDSKTVTVPMVRPAETCPDQVVVLQESVASIVVAANVPPSFTGQPRATVLIDGKELGELVLPYTAGSLKPGEHVVELKSSAWRSQKPQRVIAKPGKPVTVTFALVPAPCIFRFDITPRNATVTVNGTPVLSDAVEVEPGRRHKVSVEMKGYEPWSDQVLAETGKTVPINVVLERVTEAEAPVIILPP